MTVLQHPLRFHDRTYRAQHDRGDKPPVVKRAGKFVSTETLGATVARAHRV